MTPQLHHLNPRLALWSAFDPKVKADLCSTAILGPDGLFFIDPIPLPNSELSHLLTHAKPAGIIVTNSNHWRHAVDFAAHFSVPIYANASATGPDSPSSISIKHGKKVGESLEAIAVDGAVAGEIVLHCPADGGTFIFGDALINFPPYGFTFLPAKYCSDAKEMRRSLRRLLPNKVERLLFAHGLPILNQAAAQLRGLLETDF